MAMCVIAVVGVARCQCFSPGENQTISPDRISSIGRPKLCPSKTERNDQHLTKGMCTPCGARIRLKRYIRTPNTRWPGCLKQRVNTNRANQRKNAHDKLPRAGREADQNCLQRTDGIARTNAPSDLAWS